VPVALDPLLEAKILLKNLIFEINKSILWEMYSFQVSFLKITTDLPSNQKPYFLKVSSA